MRGTPKRVRILPRRMTRSARNGPGCRQYHGVPDGAGFYDPALCGAKPAAVRYSQEQQVNGTRPGWSVQTGKTITCRKCLTMVSVGKVAP